VSRDRGNRAAAWVASYLTAWWPGAEKTPNGRAGADILGTPGVSWEVKTGADWRAHWMRQAGNYPGLPVLVYLPPGMGEKSVMHAHAVMPMHVLMQVLVEAGYAPGKAGVTP
jgi:hypothetical protein